MFLILQYLFGPLKKALEGQRFTMDVDYDKELKQPIRCQKCLEVKVTLIGLETTISNNLIRFILLNNLPSFALFQ